MMGDEYEEVTITLKVPKGYVIGEPKIEYANWHVSFPEYISIPLTNHNEDMWKKKP